MVKVSKQTVKKTTKKTRRPTRTSSVVDRIRPLGEGQDEYLRINLYGRSGTGKTTLWATFPKPILCIVCSGANKPGELKSLDTPKYRKTIHQIVIETSEEVSEVLEYQRETGKFATVVLDHATGLQELVVKEVAGLKEIPIQMTWGILSQKQWQPVNAQMKERMRAILDLECNSVIIAQERTFKAGEDDDSDGLFKPFIASALSPGTTGWLNYACDYVCQTVIRPKTEEVMIQVGDKQIPQEERIPGQVEYCLRIAPSDVYASKFRVPKGSLPGGEFIVDPSYEKIMKILQGGG